MRPSRYVSSPTREVLKNLGRFSERPARTMEEMRRSASADSRTSVSSCLPFHGCCATFGGRHRGAKGPGKARKLMLRNELNHAYASRHGGSDSYSTPSLTFAAAAAAAYYRVGVRSCVTLKVKKERAGGRARRPRRRVVVRPRPASFFTFLSTHEVTGLRPWLPHRVLPLGARRCLMIVSS